MESTLREDFKAAQAQLQNQRQVVLKLLSESRSNGVINPANVAAPRSWWDWVYGWKTAPKVIKTAAGNPVSPNTAEGSAIMEQVAVLESLKKQVVELKLQNMAQRYHKPTDVPLGGAVQATASGPRALQQPYTRHQQPAQQSPPLVGRNDGLPQQQGVLHTHTAMPQQTLSYPVLNLAGPGTGLQTSNSAIERESFELPLPADMPPPPKDESENDNADSTLGATGEAEHSADVQRQKSKTRWWRKGSKSMAHGLAATADTAVPTAAAAAASNGAPALFRSFPLSSASHHPPGATSIASPTASADNTAITFRPSPGLRVHTEPEQKPGAGVLKRVLTRSFTATPSKASSQPASPAAAVAGSLPGVVPPPPVIPATLPKAPPVPFPGRLDAHLAELHRVRTVLMTEQTRLGQMEAELMHWRAQMQAYMAAHGQQWAAPAPRPGLVQGASSTSTTSPISPAISTPTTSVSQQVAANAGEPPAAAAAATAAAASAAAHGGSAGHAVHQSSPGGGNAVSGPTIMAGSCTTGEAQNEALPRMHDQQQHDGQTAVRTMESTGSAQTLPSLSHLDSGVAESHDSADTLPSLNQAGAAHAHQAGGAGPSYDADDAHNLHAAIMSSSVELGEAAEEAAASVASSKGCARYWCNMRDVQGCSGSTRYEGQHELAPSPSGAAPRATPSELATLSPKRQVGLVAAPAHTTSARSDLRASQPGTAAPAQACAAAVTPVNSSEQLLEPGKPVAPTVAAAAVAAGAAVGVAVGAALHKHGNRRQASHTGEPASKGAPAAADLTASLGAAVDTSGTLHTAEDNASREGIDKLGSNTTSQQQRPLGLPHSSPIPAAATAVTAVEGDEGDSRRSTEDTVYCSEGDAILSSGSVAGDSVHKAADTQVQLTTKPSLPAVIDSFSFDSSAADGWYEDEDGHHFPRTPHSLEAAPWESETSSLGGSQAHGKDEHTIPTVLQVSAGAGERQDGRVKAVSLRSRDGSKESSLDNGPLHSNSSDSWPPDKDLSRGSMDDGADLTHSQTSDDAVVLDTRAAQLKDYTVKQQLALLPPESFAPETPARADSVRLQPAHRDASAASTAAAAALLGLDGDEVVAADYEGPFAAVAAGAPSGASADAAVVPVAGPVVSPSAASHSPGVSRRLSSRLSSLRSASTMEPIKEDKLLTSASYTISEGDAGEDDESDDEELPMRPAVFRRVSMGHFTVHVQNNDGPARTASIAPIAVQQPHEHTADSPSARASLDEDADGAGSVANAFTRQRSQEDLDLAGPDIYVPVRYGSTSSAASQLNVLSNRPMRTWSSFERSLGEDVLNEHILPAASMTKRYSVMRRQDLNSAASVPARWGVNAALPKDVSAIADSDLTLATAQSVPGVATGQKKGTSAPSADKQRMAVQQTGESAEQATSDSQSAQNQRRSFSSAGIKVSLPRAGQSVASKADTLSRGPADPALPQEAHTTFAHRFADADTALPGSDHEQQHKSSLADGTAEGEVSPFALAESGWGKGVGYRSGATGGPALGGSAREHVTTTATGEGQQRSLDSHHDSPAKASAQSRLGSSSLMSERANLGGRTSSYVPNSKGQGNGAVQPASNGKSGRYSTDAATSVLPLAAQEKVMDSWSGYEDSPYAPDSRGSSPDVRKALPPDGGQQHSLNTKEPRSRDEQEGTFSTALSAQPSGTSEGHKGQGHKAAGTTQRQAGPAIRHWPPAGTKSFSTRTGTGARLPRNRSIPMQGPPQKPSARWGIPDA